MVNKIACKDNQFKHLRKKAGLTQIKVAELLGIEHSAVSKWECGRTLPDQSILPKLANLYNTTIEYLLTGNDIEKEQTLAEVIAEYMLELTENSQTLILNSIKTLYQLEKGEYPHKIDEIRRKEKTTFRHIKKPCISRASIQIVFYLFFL